MTEISNGGFQPSGHGSAADRRDGFGSPVWYRMPPCSIHHRGMSGRVTFELTGLQTSTSRLHCLIVLSSLLFSPFCYRQTVRMDCQSGICITVAGEVIRSTLLAKRQVELLSILTCVERPIQCLLAARLLGLGLRCCTTDLPAHRTRPISGGEMAATCSLQNRGSPEPGPSFEKRTECP